MKIAVATICKNETQEFVTRWSESSQQADYRIILDTGSDNPNYTMPTVGDVVWYQKVFTPWRFDDARNHAMSLIPDTMDYVIWLDMDEELQPGWREALETATTTRPRYKYVWSWQADGSEGLTYAGDKIHQTTFYQWHHPVHEVLKPVGIIETQEFINGLEIHHHPDPTKSRGQYLPLLELAVKENPMDDRNQFYLAREYFFNNKPGEAQYHFMRHLDLATWLPERAASHRYLAKMRPYNAQYHLLRAVAEDPTRRESWVALAQHYYNEHDWLSSRYACQMALRITTKPLDYLCEADAWGWLPHDLMAIACHHLGDSDEAFFHGSTALEFNPTDERLQANLKWYR